MNTDDHQWWDAVLVLGPDTELKMMGSFAAIRTWAQRYASHIFDYTIYEGKGFVQWGTNYHYLMLVPHQFVEGEARPVEAYSGTTGKTYPTWDALVAAETEGWAVTVLITDTKKNRTWPYSIGLFADRAEAERVRNNMRAKWNREAKKPFPAYPNQTYKFHVRPIWKMNP